jgi:hypothetical protein
LVGAVVDRRAYQGHVPRGLICPRYVVGRYPQQSFGGVRIARGLRKLGEGGRLPAMVFGAYRHDASVESSLAPTHIASIRFKTE